MKKQPIFGKDPEKIFQLLSIGEGEENSKEVQRNVGDTPNHSEVQANQQAAGSDRGSSATEENVIEKLHTNIEGYRIIKVLGEGGMGIVYLAEQQYPVRRLVALKIIKPGMDSKRVMARFEAEQQALAWLDHPNIAQVFDAGTTETRCPFFVMEYVKGMPITEYCDHYKCPIEQRLRLFQRVCQAVQHAHQKGIIHRDIKPSNILVAIVDDQAVPKIIDFGVAKAVVQPLTEGTLYTEQGQLFGTPEYMSPEQADMAIEDIDTRSDIYSLGVLLYELLTGVLPFDPQTLREGGIDHIRKVIRETDPKTPSTRLTRLGEEAKRVAENRRTEIGTLAKNLRKELEWIPLKAVRKERTERYRSASELSDDIENYLQGNPLMAGPLTVSYRFKKYIRRNKKVFAAVVVAAAALVIGFTVSTISLVREQHARRIAVAAQEKEAGLRAQAQANELEMRRIAYASDMSLAQQALEINDMGRAQQLLDAHRPAPGKDDLRGWEWRYLWQKCRSDALGELCRYHEEPSVLSVAYSPDGRVLAVAGVFPGFVDIWDVAGRNRIKELLSKGSFCVAFSPCGDLLAASAEGQIRLWRTDTWDIAPGIPLGYSVKVLKFSPDGTRLASLGFGRELAVWEVGQGPVVRRIGGGRLGAAGPRRLDFSPDGKALVIADTNDCLRVIDVATGDTILGPWEAHSELITSVAWSPNGSVIASGSGWEGGPIRLWDTASGELVGELEGHMSWISEMVLSKDGLRLYSSSGDQTIRIWDVGQQRSLATLRGSRHEVLGLALSPDGTTLASACKDGGVAFWSADPQQEEEMPRVIPMGGSARVAFAPDSRVLAVPQGDTVSLFDLATGRETELCPKMDADVSAVAYSPDGTLLVSGSEKGTIRVWSYAGGDPIEEFDDHKEKIVLLHFRTDGVRMLSLDATGKAIWWDALTWQAGQILAVQLPDGWQRPWGPVDVSPDGRLLAFGTQEGAVRWVNAETGELLGTTGGAQPIAQVAFSTDGSHLASTSVHGTVVLWDPSSLRSVSAFRAHLLAAQGVTFSPDGRRLATGGATSRDAVRLWDLFTHRELITLSGQPVATSFVNFSPDGRWLITCSKNEGKLHVWRAPSWEEIEAEEKKLENRKYP